MSGQVRQLPVLGFRLALRAMRWRAAAAATMFAIALIAVLAATIGPIYLHSVDETVLARHLRQADEYRRDVFVSRTTLLGYPHLDWPTQVRQLSDEVADSRWFAPAVFTDRVGITYDAAGLRTTGAVASISGLCAHVRIVAGSCLPAQSGQETLVSARTAKLARVSVGDTVTPATMEDQPIPLQVVGIYQPIAPDGAYWARWNFLPGGEKSASAMPQVDSFFVGPSVLLSRIAHLEQTLAANVALLPGRVAYDDEAGLRHAVGRATGTATTLADRESSTGVSATTVSTELPKVLDASDDETSLARTLVTVATAQLAFLAIVVLYVVVSSSSAARGPEVALAKLRGRRTLSVLFQGIVQPVVLVVLAAPVGALLAWVIVRLTASPLLGQSVSVVFPSSAFAIAAGTAGGAILAAVAAARRIVVAPVGALLRRGADAPGSKAGLAIADAAAVTLAIAALVELKAGGLLDRGTSNPLSTLSPALLAIAASIVVLRLLPFAGRALIRATRDSSRVATFLAVRQIVRRPAAARSLVLVALALAIGTFAVTNWSVARSNRQARALSDAGASTVLLVRPGAQVTDLRTAVDRADPGGHSMAVAYSEADQLPPLLAVDTHRFAGVGAWVAGNTSAGLTGVLHTLAGHRPAPVVAHGSALRLAVDLTSSTRYAVRLAVGFTGDNHQISLRKVGPIHAGAGIYDLTLPRSCAAGCPVAELSLTADTPDDPYSPDLREHSIDATVGAQIYSAGSWHAVPSLGEAARWRSDGQGYSRIRSAAGGALSVLLRQGGGAAGWASLVSAATPTTVPAVVAPGTADQYVGNQIHDATSVGLDGNSLSIDGVYRSDTLPRVGQVGAMVDFGTALTEMKSYAAATTQYEVWLSPSAPADMTARLAAQHVRVTGTIRAARSRASLEHSGPAFADSLFLIAALAAVVLALGASVVGGVISARRRSYELAALEAVGVAPRVLRRASTAEQGLVLGLGLVVGLAAGLVGSRLSLPSTPMFVNESVGPPRVYDLPWGLLSVLVAAVVVVFVLVSVLIARLIERQATPGQLRGAQQ